MKGTVGLSQDRSVIAWIHLYLWGGEDFFFHFASFLFPRFIIFCNIAIFSDFGKQK